MVTKKHGSQSSETATTTKSNTTTTSGTQKATKSSDANLSNLGIRPNDFTGFKMGTTTYDVTVPEDIEKVEVYATANNSKAKVTGTGTKNLEKGKNTLSVVVTAEDGTTKTYTINVTRQGEDDEEEHTENVQDKYSGDGLASLKVGDLELTPKFDTNIYEYKVKYIGEDEKIDIDATATDPYYTVEVTGNQNLKEGENIITILVSDPDGNNVATYQVTINKSLVDEEAIAKEQEEARKKEEQKKKLIIGGIIVVVVIGIIIFVIVRHRRNKAWAEEYSVPFSGLNDDDDEDDQEYRNQLEDYDENMNYIEEIEEEEPKRKRHKAKRFK